MQFNNIMLDLETLDTISSAIVVSIGAVAFDPYSNAIGPTFYAELTDNLRTQQKYGRTISADTVVWWMRQGQAAQQLFIPSFSSGNGVRTTTFEALERFAGFVEDNGADRVELWGNGADFDNMILGSLYDSFGQKKPWSYSRNRCFRTMKNHPDAPPLPGRLGVHHNALDDAMTQAVHLQTIMGRLRNL